MSTPVCGRFWQRTSFQDCHIFVPGFQWGRRLWKAASFPPSVALFLARGTEKRSLKSECKGDVKTVAERFTGDDMTSAVGNGVVAGPEVYQMGLDTLKVVRSTFHRQARAKVVDGLKAALTNQEQGVLFLQGGQSLAYYDTDEEALFRQENYFFYLFGVLEAGWYGAIDLQKGTSTLFMPKLPESYAVWMGPLRGPTEYQQMLGVDEVHYIDDMVDWLKHSGAPCLHVLNGKNTDSGCLHALPAFEGIDDFVVEKMVAAPVIAKSRTIKLAEEMEILRYANKIGSQAHVALMRGCKPGMMEYQLESLFLHYCEFHGGCRTEAYTCIAASGPNGAVLHYGHEGAPNDKLIADGDMILADMGCKYYGYNSDITTSFPANGKFTSNQKLVYEAVLNANRAVKKTMKPGVLWLDMHKFAERVILEALIAGGLLCGDVDEMMNSYMGAVFMPHGLGHFLGLDVHDVGGYESRMPRVDEPGRKHLRTSGVLEEGMVITVEPGCYFNPVLINAAMNDSTTKRFFVNDRMKEFEGFGGVRIEDNVIITSEGIECLTNVPRTVEEIESVMAGGNWP